MPNQNRYLQRLNDDPAAMGRTPGSYRWLTGATDTSPYPASMPGSPAPAAVAPTPAPVPTGPGGTGVTYNAAGAPVYPGNNLSDFLGYSDPQTAVSQALAGQGGTTWAGNPWVQMLMKYAPGMPLMHTATGAPGSEGFNQWLGNYVGAMRGPASGLESQGNPLYSHGELQALMGQLQAGQGPAALQERLTNMDPKTSMDTLTDLLTTSGMTALNPFYLEAALNDLQQKQYDYTAYVNYGTDATPTSFWDYLMQSGWMNRYFGG